MWRYWKAIAANRRLGGRGNRYEIVLKSLRNCLSCSWSCNWRISWSAWARIWISGRLFSCSWVRSALALVPYFYQKHYLQEATCRLKTCVFRKAMACIALLLVRSPACWAFDFVICQWCLWSYHHVPSDPSILSPLLQFIDSFKHHH